MFSLVGKRENIELKLLEKEQVNSKENRHIIKKRWNKKMMRRKFKYYTIHILYFVCICTYDILYVYICMYMHAYLHFCVSLFKIIISDNNNYYTNK